MRRRRGPRRLWLRLCLFPFSALLVLFGACAGEVTPPIVVPLIDAASRVPVVVVPGISGSGLRERDGGKIVWGLGPEVLGPKDGGYDLARPIPSKGVANGPDRLEATAVIDTMRLFGGFIIKPVYGPVMRTLERNGWTPGDLSAPSVDADLYAFAYDWRQDNLEAVGKLLERLHALARAYGWKEGDEPFAIDLICQSNGAHICRYLLKYGDADLDDALAGHGSPPRGLRIRKLLLVGTSNGGSVRILREVHRGRRYVTLIGRYMQPETLFTFPAIFQDLPTSPPRPFVDGHGHSLDIDLFDAETWRRYDISVFTDAARKRMAKRPDLFATEQDRFEFLVAMLARSKKLHEALARDVEAFDTAYYLLQSAYSPSPERVVLRDKPGDGYELQFTGDKALGRDPYLAYLVSSPGDGHATYDSQRALSPQELQALAAAPYLVRGSHFEMILDPSTLRRIVDFLRMPMKETVK